MIVYGERRFRASKLAGRKEIRAEIREIGDIDAAEAAFIENMRRETRVIYALLQVFYDILRVVHKRKRKANGVGIFACQIFLVICE